MMQICAQWWREASKMCPMVVRGFKDAPNWRDDANLRSMVARGFE
jgi:hypothetical protein